MYQNIFTSNVWNSVHFRTTYWKENPMVQKWVFGCAKVCLYLPGSQIQQLWVVVDWTHRAGRTQMFGVWTCWKIALKKTKQLICLKGSILYGSNKTSGNHLENKLAKFGYIPDIKVKWIQIFLYILGYLLELINKIWQLGFCFLSKSGEFGPFFSLKILCKGQDLFFR